jgi:hypothetical protein
MSKIGKNQLPHPFDNRIVCSNYKETFRKVLAGKLDGQLVTACWSACEVQDMPDVGGPEGDQDKCWSLHTNSETQRSCPSLQTLSSTLNRRSVP